MPYLPLGDGLLQQFQPQSFGTLRLFRSAPALHRLLIGISLAQVRKAKGIRLYRSGRRRVLMAIDLPWRMVGKVSKVILMDLMDSLMDGFHIFHTNLKQICFLIGNFARVHSLRSFLRHTHTTKQ